jgi:excisionase family DNA binding protein
MWATAGAFYMKSIDPGVTGRARTSKLEPLAVSPRQACILLDCGPTYLYGLIDSGEVESYREGRSRKITSRSIHNHQERQLAAERRRRQRKTPAEKSEQ